MEDRLLKPNALYQQIGSAIASRRAAQKISQLTLATAVGLTRTSISNIEKGRQKMLVHTLIDIAEALELSPSALLPTKEQAQRLLPRSSRSNSADESVFRFSGKVVSPAEYATIAAVIEDIQANPTLRTSKKKS